MAERPFLLRTTTLLGTLIVVLAAGMWARSLVASDLCMISIGRQGISLAVVRHEMIIELWRWDSRVNVRRRFDCGYWRSEAVARRTLTDYHPTRPGQSMPEITGLGFFLRFGTGSFSLLRGWGHVLTVGIPWWFVMVVALLGPLRWLSHHRRRRNDPAPRCPACGYDLRASPDACPECGEARAAEHRSRNDDSGGGH